MPKKVELDPEDLDDSTETTTAAGGAKKSIRSTESEGADDDDDADDQGVDDDAGDDGEGVDDGDDESAEGDEDDAGGEEESEQEEEHSELDGDEEEEEPRPERDGGRRERHPEDGRLTGLLNQMPEAVRREILEDPGKFGRMIQELRAGRELDYGSAVEKAVMETVGEFKDMSPANRRFFETLGKKLSGAIGRQVSQAAQSGGVRAHRQFVVREGMRKVEKTPLYKNNPLFKKAFWGEIEQMRQQRKWFPPDVVFRRVERDFLKYAKGEDVGGGGRREVEQERPRRSADLGASRSSGQQGVQKKKSQSSAEAWMTSDYAKQLDRRELRRS